MTAFMGTLLLLVTVPSVWGAPERFEVHQLPGWAGPLKSKVYSGFASAGIPPNGKGEQFFHYVMVQSERDPANDPVVLWYNGGPGAASMFGLLVELGPSVYSPPSPPCFGSYFRQPLAIASIDRRRGELPRGRAATVIAVNNPPPIGFSFCEPAGPSADGYSCGDWDDTKVAQANHKFLINLFSTEFPELAKNELYITGESYAGVYVPTIAREILKAPGPLNLKGFAVGDGCMGTEVLCGDQTPDKGPWYEIEFLHGHGQVSEKLYRQIMSECPEPVLRSGSGMSPACKASVSEMNAAVGGYFGYSLYDDCIDEESFSELEFSIGGALNDYPCPGKAMDIWLNHSAVKLALNIPVDARFNNGDNGVGFNYTLTEPNLLPFYAEVILNTSLRVLVYNGDTDPGINSMVTQDKYFNYFSSIGLEPSREWRPWTLDGRDRMGGYTVQYPGGFSYLTIRGAGHMVPEYKPAAAHAFLTHFLENTPFPEYNPTPGGRFTRSRRFP